MPGPRLRLIAWLVITLLGAAHSARASMPPSNLPDLIASVLPACVNVAFMRLEKQSDGEIKITNRGVGSGYVVDAAGIIATNRHVTDGGNEYFVTFADQAQLRATLIYRSPDIDLALLRVFPTSPLPAIKWGDSSAMRRGDQVVAIGNPLGLSSTVTTGIISALDRDIHETPLDALMQLDAAINPGNSGGPLFNMQGEVIGMNTAFYGGNYSTGLSLAIPGNDVQFVLNSLHAHGRVQRGYLGATLQNVTPRLAFAFGLPRVEGAIVAGVQPGTPAMAAGLRQGDILQKMGDQTIRNLRDANRFITAADVGEPLSLQVLRDGEAMTLTVTLTDASTENETVDMNPLPPPVHALTGAEMGIAGVALTDELRQKFSLKPGTEGVVLISVKPGSIGSFLGFEVGDVVLRVGNHPVAGVDDVLDAAARARAEGRDFIALLVAGKNGMRWTGIPVVQ